MIDEDAALRSDIAALGPEGLAAFGRILSDPDKLDGTSRRLLRERQTSAVRDLSTLVAVAASDEA